MLPSGPAAAPVSHRPVRTRRTAAWLCSIAFHLVVVYFASRAAWPVVESEERVATNVVWLEEIRLPEPEPVVAPEPVEQEPEPEPVVPEPEPEPEPPRPSEPEQTVSEARSEPPATDASPESRDADSDPAPVAASEGDSPEAETPDQSEPATAPPAQTGEGEPSRNYIVREIDWEEERRRAVERVGEELAQEQNYRTFSLDDVTEEAVPEEPGPAEDIFASSSGWSGGPSLLTPGRSTGPIGRRLTALCDVLGGISLFGVASICVEPGPEAELFAHLKPAYMLSRPVCTEVPGAEAPTGASASEPVVKCRMVPKDELAEGEDLNLEEAVVREDRPLQP